MSGIRPGAVFGVVMLALLTASMASAAPEAAEPPESIQLTSEQEERYRNIIWKLRCLVCQNESIAESHAPLANDLRRIVRRQLAEGRSDREIKQYMRDRYGDFVLYQPPFNTTTALLWLAPGLLLLVAVALLLRRLRSGVGEADDDDDTPPEADSGSDNAGDRQ